MLSEFNKYINVKEQYEDFIILINSGDCHKAYGKDAEEITYYLELEITKEDIDNEEHKVAKIPNDKHIDTNILVLSFYNTIGVIENNILTVHPKFDTNEEKYTINLEEKNKSSNHKCLLCDNETYYQEYLLCTDCYYKYKNKNLFLELSPKNNSIKLLDASYEGKFECDDGHVVKSQAERDIDNYLFENNIKHGYETSLVIYDNDKRIELHPDFCVYKNDEKIYIEYWGIEDDSFYKTAKKYKLELYKKAGITLINMYKKTDLKNIRRSLEDKLNHYKKGQINYFEEF